MFVSRHLPRRWFMAIPGRHSITEAIAAGCRTFFVTSSTWGKRALLQSDAAASLLIKVLYEYRDQGRFRLHEFVVMPDHVHILITVAADSSIERAVQFVKGGFAFRAGRQLGFRSPVWQRGFSEVRVGNVAQFARMRDYIRHNPVARHLVGQSAEFPYSSARAGFELDPPPQGLKPN
jgi:putative transposase